MISYDLVIGKTFLGERHIQNNRVVVGYNAEEADTQYWVNTETDVLQTEELSFDRSTGDLVITLIDKKDNTLFLSLTVPVQEIAFALSKMDMSPILTKMKSDIIKARTTMKELAAKARKKQQYHEKASAYAENIE